MIEFTVETAIGRAPAEVFAYVTDPAKLGTWQTNTVSASIEAGGAMGLGARLREVHRAGVGSPGVTAEPADHAAATSW